jgi:hypothetical protein
MNANNPLVPLTRGVRYGISEIPFTILQGGSEENQRFGLEEIGSDAFNAQISSSSLGLATFEIELDDQWSDGELELTTLVRSLENYSENVDLYLVIIETEVTAYTGSNGDNEFRNVVLDMVPTPAGILLGDNWIPGKEASRQSTWTYKSYVEDEEDLAVVAFIQDRSTRRILQAAISYADKTVDVSQDFSEQPQMLVYPNPTRDHFHVNLGERTTENSLIEIIDMRGQVIMNMAVPPGYQLIRMNAEVLRPGLYMIRWTASGELKGMVKMIKSR